MGRALASTTGEYVEVEFDQVEDHDKLLGAMLVVVGIPVIVVSTYDEVEVELLVEQLTEVLEV